MPQSTISTAQVHRFHNKVAVHVGNGSTTYLTPAEARLLAVALADCAGDIEARSFGESTLLSAIIELDTSN